MRSIVQFKCDVCGKVFSDKWKCDKHERAHRKPKKIARVTYDRLIETKQGAFPYCVTVECEDGSLAEYRWAHLVDVKQ